MKNYDIRPGSKTGSSISFVQIIYNCYKGSNNSVREKGDAKVEMLSFDITKNVKVKMTCFFPNLRIL